MILFMYKSMSILVFSMYIFFNIIRESKKNYI